MSANDVKLMFSWAVFFASLIVWGFATFRKRPNVRVAAYGCGGMFIGLFGMFVR
jgi:hypothetical protein